MTQMEVFQFPDELLERARKITLADLLDSGFSQCWAVSMMANAVNCSHHFDDRTDEEEFLEFRMSKVCNAIPHDERTALFAASSELVRKRQAERREAA